MLLYGGTGQHVPEAIKGSFNLWLPVSSDAGWPSFTGVVLSDDDELAFPEASLWLLSCELAGSVKASWVELESESKTTSLSWLRSGKTNKEGGGKEKKKRKQGLCCQLHGRRQITSVFGIKMENYSYLWVFVYKKVILVKWSFIKIKWKYCTVKTFIIIHYM